MKRGGEAENKDVKVGRFGRDGK